MLTIYGGTSSPGTQPRARGLQAHYTYTQKHIRTMWGKRELTTRYPKFRNEVNKNTPCWSISAQSREDPRENE